MRMAEMSVPSSSAMAADTAATSSPRLGIARTAGETEAGAAGAAGAAEGEGSAVLAAVPPPTILPISVISRIRQISPIKVTPIPIRQTNKFDTSICD